MEGRNRHSGQKADDDDDDHDFDKGKALGGVVRRVFHFGIFVFYNNQLKAAKLEFRRQGQNSNKTLSQTRNRIFNYYQKALSKKRK